MPRSKQQLITREDIETATGESVPSPQELKRRIHGFFHFTINDVVDDLEKKIRSIALPSHGDGTPARTVEMIMAAIANFRRAPDETRRGLHLLEIGGLAELLRLRLGPQSKWIEAGRKCCERGSGNAVTKDEIMKVVAHTKKMMNGGVSFTGALKRAAKDRMALSTAKKYIKKKMLNK
jgi:hypothetical protein